jgi:hypothetical protein
VTLERFKLNGSHWWLAKRRPRRNRRGYLPIVAAAVTRRSPGRLPRPTQATVLLNMLQPRTSRSRQAGWRETRKTTEPGVGNWLTCSGGLLVPPKPWRRRMTAEVRCGPCSAVIDRRYRIPFDPFQNGGVILFSSVEDEVRHAARPTDYFRDARGRPRQKRLPA